MIYEHRTYSVLPGKMSEFCEVFGNEIVPLFPKHGAKLIGTWQTAIGQSNEFVYILGFKDLADQERFWRVFHEDEGFKKYAQSSQREPRVAYATSKILQPTPYSPLK